MSPVRVAARTLGARILLATPLRIHHLFFATTGTLGVTLIVGHGLDQLHPHGIAAAAGTAVCNAVGLSPSPIFGALHRGLTPLVREFVRQRGSMLSIYRESLQRFRQLTTADEAARDVIAVSHRRSQRGDRRQLRLRVGVP